MSFHDAVDRASAAPAGEQLDILLAGVEESEREAAKAALGGFSLQLRSQFPQTEMVAEVAAEPAEEAAVAEPAVEATEALAEAAVAEGEEALAEAAVAETAGEAVAETAGEAVAETAVVDAFGLTDEQRVNIKAAFDAIDIDGSGFVETAELGKVMQALGCDLSEEEVQNIFGKVDVDGSGAIDFEEYLKMVAEALKGQQ